MRPETVSVCVKCAGTGAIAYERTRQYGDMETHECGSNPCDCRMMLPPREGVVQWWSLETTYERTITLPMIDRRIVVSVRSEVPLSQDNYRVVMRGNRYYPCTVDIGLHGSDSESLWPSLARELAVALIEAADRCDAIDKPCLDACGHWAPCDCGKEASR